MTEAATESSPWLTVGERRFRSRLIVGIEQYADGETVRQVLEAAGADVFITTYDLQSRHQSLLLSDLDRQIDLASYHWIGTTSFARSAPDAVRTARHLRDAFGLDVIKLDVRGEDNGPDPRNTLVAAEELIGDGFSVLPFIRPVPSLAKEVQALGCVALRLMASPVASYRGIDDVPSLRTCIDEAGVPTIVEGGIGTVSHVTEAFQLGATAVLVNTMIARAARPPLMAAAVRSAVAAARLSQLASA
jgi:thiazole synthase